jgi:hypothetical protein
MPRAFMPLVLVMSVITYADAVIVTARTRRNFSGDDARNPRHGLLAARSGDASVIKSHMPGIAPPDDARELLSWRTLDSA